MAITYATGSMFATIDMKNGTDTINFVVSGSNDISALTLDALTSVEHGNIIGTGGNISLIQRYSRMTASGW